MWVQRDSNLGLVEYESAALEPELCARGYTAPTSFERRATIRNGTRVVGPLRSAVAPMPVATRAAPPRFRWVDSADWPTTSSGVLRSWPRSKESLSRHTFRSTSPARQALLSMSTALLGRHPPGSERRACGGASIAKGDADPEDEDHGQQATPKTNKERRKGRYRRGEQAGRQPSARTPSARFAGTVRGCGDPDQFSSHAGGCGSRRSVRKHRTVEEYRSVARASDFT